MTDRIPEELLREARRVVDDINLNDASAVPTIARALWAERKRCAGIAEGELVDIYEDSPDVDSECNNLARRIATAILGGADE